MNSIARESLINNIKKILHLKFLGERFKLKALFLNCIAQATVEARISANIYFFHMNKSKTYKHYTEVSIQYLWFVFISIGQYLRKHLKFLILEKKLLTNKYY